MSTGPAGAVPAGLSVWSLGPPESEWRTVYCGPRTEPGTHVITVPEYAAELMVTRHNAEVEAARQPRATVGDVESLLTRVLVAALRELLTPRWWRRLRRAG